MISNKVLYLDLGLANLKFLIPKIPCLLVIKTKLDSIGFHCLRGSKTKKGWMEHASGLRHGLVDTEDLAVGQPALG